MRVLLPSRDPLPLAFKTNFLGFTHSGIFVTLGHPILPRVLLVPRVLPASAVRTTLLPTSFYVVLPSERCRLRQLRSQFLIPSTPPRLPGLACYDISFGRIDSMEQQTSTQSSFGVTGASCPGCHALLVYHFGLSPSQPPSCRLRESTLLSAPTLMNAAGPFDCSHLVLPFVRLS